MGMKFSASARLTIREFHLNIPACKLFSDFSAEAINQSYFLILITAGVIGNILSFLVIKGTFNETINLIEESLMYIICYELNYMSLVVPCASLVLSNWIYNFLLARVLWEIVEIVLYKYFKFLLSGYDSASQSTHVLLYLHLCACNCGYCNTVDRSVSYTFSN